MRYGLAGPVPHVHHDPPAVAAHAPEAGGAGAEGAAAAYALNRRLSPGGDFAEDALVREFDMALEHGDLATVERLRAQYESEFPEGRHLDDIRAEAAELARRWAWVRLSGSAAVIRVSP